MSRWEESELNVRAILHRKGLREFVFRINCRWADNAILSTREARELAEWLLEMTGGREYDDE